MYMDAKGNRLENIECLGGGSADVKLNSHNEALPVLCENIGIPVMLAPTSTG
jgi:hypothetical protein